MASKPNRVNDFIVNAIKRGKAGTLNDFYKACVSLMSMIAEPVKICFWQDNLTILRKISFHSGKKFCKGLVN